MKLQKNFQPRQAIVKVVWREDFSWHTCNFNRISDPSCIYSFIHLSIYLANIFEVPIIYQVLFRLQDIKVNKAMILGTNIDTDIVGDIMFYGVLRKYNGNFK